MKTIKENILHQYFQKEMIKISTDSFFTYTSGETGPLYCDNRELFSYPSFRQEVIIACKEKISELFNHDFNSIIGIATGGIPLGVALSLHFDMPFLYIRKEQKFHGKKKALEGKVDLGAKILLIEDLINTGKSTFDCINQLLQQQLSVTGVFSLVNYERHIFLSQQKEKYANISFHSLLNKNDFVDYLRNEKKESLASLLEEWQ